jgi:hypothetical protein
VVREKPTESSTAPPRALHCSRMITHRLLDEPAGARAWPLLSDPLGPECPDAPIPLVAVEGGSGPGHLARAPYFTFWPRFKITDCDLERWMPWASAAVNLNEKSSGKRSAFCLTAWLRTLVSTRADRPAMAQPDYAPAPVSGGSAARSAARTASAALIRSSTSRSSTSTAPSYSAMFRASWPFDNTRQTVAPKPSVCRSGSRGPARGWPRLPAGPRRSAQALSAHR